MKLNLTTKNLRDAGESAVVLTGFNNISKSLTASFYHVVYTPAKEPRDSFLLHCNRYFSGDFLTTLLYKVSDLIGATVLHASKNNYDPLGASASLLIAEATPNSTLPRKSSDQADFTPSELPDQVDVSRVSRQSELLHLDKSHLAAHTYPDSHLQRAHAWFRIDIDLSTCGEVNPLHALDTLLGELTPDVFTLDLRFRGFTLDQAGNYCFNDQSLVRFLPFINAAHQKLYQVKETCLGKHRVFMFKGIRADFTAPEYQLKARKNMEIPSLKKPLATGSRAWTVVSQAAHKIFVLQ
ncbi:s-adenosylmethionine decarboxylase [Spirochaetota bacterium]|nr:s-adenosylmethionine decarboxylase [Spirochaetota bacterium]